MTGFVIAFLVGVLCIVLGISNYRGNIETLHSYHRKRVTEENRIPFGRKVGLGTMIIGAGICVYSILSGIAVWTENELFTLIGAGVMVAALIAGLGLSFWAMIKYNKGIF